MAPTPTKFRKDLQGERLFTASQWQLMWWRFTRHKLAVISMGVLIFAYVTALFCEFVAPHDPNRYDPRWLQGGTLLFDNEADPYQLNNLAYQPDHKALLAGLEGELQGWLTRLGDKFMPGDAHIRELGQAEEWQIRQEHFYGFGTRNF